VSVLLPHGLDHVIENLPLGHSYTADQLIDEHTVLPFFAPFLESTRYQNAKLDMRGNGGLAIGLRLGLHAGIRWPNRLRHCSVCDAENRDRFGETFWARLHQIAGINICPVHRCFLEETLVTRSLKGFFRAISAESVCGTTSPRYLDESDPEQVIQFSIARDAAWLLDVNRLRPGPEALSKSYLFCALNQGFAFGRKFRQIDLHSAFTRRYSKELLRLLGLEFVEGKRSWLKRVFHISARIQYPIRHLIIMNFLGFAVADLFDQMPEEEAKGGSGVQRQITDFVDAPSPGGEAFGTAPWPCRNPISACRGKLLIQECTERMTPSHGRTNYRKLIGDFVCPQCGFAYSRFAPREDISKRMVWVRDYGHAWIAELRKVWSDRRYSIIQVASHLGVTAMVVRAQAFRCGLVFPKPGQRTLQRAKDWPLQRRRRGSAYWAGRDADLSRRVADVASTLFQAPGKPVRVTQCAIFRLFEDSTSLYCKRDKLPATVRAISKVVESEEEFGHRLLRHLVTEHASACVPLVGGRLKKAVGYWRLKRFPSLRLEINSLLSRSGGTEFAPVNSEASKKRSSERA